MEEMCCPPHLVEEDYFLQQSSPGVAEYLSVRVKYLSIRVRYQDLHEHLCRGLPIASIVINTLILIIVATLILITITSTDITFTHNTKIHVINIRDRY
jgi:hypothetical protein